MKNTMLRLTNVNATIYTTCPSENVNKLIEMFKEAPFPPTVETWESDKMKLEDLPEEVQNKVKETLRVFNKAHVTFEHNQFEVSAHYCLKARYGYDHFWCGEYKASEVFTEEERRQNLAELNSYEFPEWAW